MGLLPEADPSRWTLRGSSVPLEVSTLAGDLRPDPAALDLWSYRGASPRIPPFHDGVIVVRAYIPDDGQLRIRLGAEAASAGPDAPVRGPPRLPGGGPSPSPFSPQGASLLVDRTSRASVYGSGLSCAPAAAPGPDTTLTLTVAGGVVDVAADGRPLTRCTGTFPAGDVVFSSGVRRIQLRSVELGEFHDDFGGLLRSRPGRVAAIFAGLLLGLALPRRIALAGLPLLALPVLGRLDMRGWLDSLRMIEVPDALGPALFAGVPAAVALLLAGASMLSLRATVGLGLVPFFVTLALTRSPGWLLLAGGALPCALLGWVNSHPVSRRAAASWASCLVLFGCVEYGLRGTALNGTWTRTAGWRRASEEFRELLEIRQYRAYPDSGFPVRPPPPRPGGRRIVALGGSSTGGAYQMDDIDLFWPKKLEERLDGWEVVNQGVGGWNSLHVRLYVESQIERLDADILAVYIGHNDVLSLAPVPYRQLYARYRETGTVVPAISTFLNGYRSYVGLKFALLALRDREGAVAVPVPDARENLAAVIAVAKAHDARVLLLTEGLNPSPLPMRPYGEMLAALARDTGSLYFDAAEALWRADDPDLFLDDCHLSQAGHVRLADWIREALGQAGWLEAGGGPR